MIGAIGEGLRAAPSSAGIEIPGGEIAQVGDVVGGWELSGSSIGLVDLDAIVTGDAIAPGDALIGLPSSGLHSNGYTLARKALDAIPLDDERLGRPLGEVLLEPTDDLRARRARAARLRRSTSTGSPTSPATGSTTCCGSRGRSATSSPSRCRCRRSST